MIETLDLQLRPFLAFNLKHPVMDLQYSRLSQILFQTASIKIHRALLF